MVKTYGQIKNSQIQILYIVQYVLADATAERRRCGCPQECRRPAQRGVAAPARRGGGTAAASPSVPLGGASEDRVPTRTRNRDRDARRAVAVLPCGAPLNQRHRGVFAGQGLRRRARLARS